MIGFGGRPGEEKSRHRAQQGDRERGGRGELYPQEPLQWEGSSKGVAWSRWPLLHPQPGLPFPSLRPAQSPALDNFQSHLLSPPIGPGLAQRHAEAWLGLARWSNG